MNVSEDMSYLFHMSCRKHINSKIDNLHLFSYLAMNKACYKFDTTKSFTTYRTGGRSYGYTLLHEVDRYLESIIKFKDRPRIGTPAS